MIKSILKRIDWPWVLYSAMILSLVSIILANTVVDEPKLLLYSLAILLILVLITILRVTIDELKDRKRFR